MNKITLSALASVSVAVIAGASWYGYSSYQATANADYICTARIVNPTCVATSYSPWVNGTRTAYGTQQVSVSYSSSRVTCDGGGNWHQTTRSSSTDVYTSISSQITDLQQAQDAERTEVSGQYNLQYSTEACSFTETAPAAATTTTSNTNTTGGTGGVVDSTVDADTGTGN
jgi:hypothetical protein